MPTTSSSSLWGVGFALRPTRLAMIICGDSENIIPTLADDSVDLVVTDPPYGWAFMGKDWDKAVPSVALWRECLRVLKPGAFAFVMSGPRMDCLSEMGRRLGEAGFEIGFSPIFWAYASGFPKAANLSKLADKRLGAEREVVGKKVYAGGHIQNSSPDKLEPPIGTFKRAQDDRLDTRPATPQAAALDGCYAGAQFKPAIEIVIVAMKPKSEKTYIDQALRWVGDKSVGVGGTWLDDGRIPYKSSGDYAEASRESRGVCDSGHFGNAEPERRYTVPSGRFPANLLISDNAVDDGIDRPSSGRTGKKRDNWTAAGRRGEYIQVYNPRPPDSGSFSRYFSLDQWFQAKLSELWEALSWRRKLWLRLRELLAQLGKRLVQRFGQAAVDDFQTIQPMATPIKFDAKLSELPESVQRTFPFLVVPKAARSEKWFLCRVCDDVAHSSQKKAHDDHNTHCHTCGIEFNSPAQKEEHKGHKTETNILMHPTQKPVKLFAYLITLGSRPGDVVADFFGGVGTMAVGAKMLGRDWLMVEIDEEWCRIGQRRVEAVQATLI